MCAPNKAVAPRLIVELTETAALHHFEENAHFVSQLRELGVRVAIDDFGAGYTSFRNLQMLHVDMVKIDGSYVRDLASRRKTRSLCGRWWALPEFRHQDGGGMGGFGRGRRAAAEFRRRLFPGLPLRRAGIDPKWD